MRTIERIVISGADRERLERLVRDRNTPQKVVWRARIVLLASDGLTAKAIAAAELEPVDRAPLALPLCGRGGGRASEGRNPALARSAAGAEEDQAVGAHDAARETAERDPLERAQYGCGGGHLLDQRPADLARAWARAPSRQDVQGFARQELRHQGGGCGRAQSRSAG